MGKSSRKWRLKMQTRSIWLTTLSSLTVWWPCLTSLRWSCFPWTSESAIRTYPACFASETEGSLISAFPEIHIKPSCIVFSARRMTTAEKWHSTVILCNSVNRVKLCVIKFWYCELTVTSNNSCWPGHNRANTHKHNFVYPCQTVDWHIYQSDRVTQWFEALDLV